jgi:formate dehydrogenase major subunit
MGESKPVQEMVCRLSDRMGYGLPPTMPASQFMSEISRLVPSYSGITYARLERSGTVAPVTSFADPGSPILVGGPDGHATLSLAYTATI